MRSKSPKLQVCENEETNGDLVLSKSREISESPPKKHRASSPFFESRTSPSSVSRVRFTDSPLRFPSSRNRLMIVRSSEDEEQSEFNRKYSRDLRRRHRNHIYDDDGNRSRSGCGEVRRRSSRVKTNKINSVDDESTRSPKEEEDDENEKIVVASKSKRIRIRGVEDESSNHSDFNLRRSTRRRKLLVKKNENPSDEEGFNDDEEENDDEDDEIVEDDDEEEMEEDETENEAKSSNKNGGSSRPRRSRLPVDRLNYSAPSNSLPSGGQSTHTHNSSEIRNLDQYSSDEEFKGVSLGRRKTFRKYNMRENRRVTNRYTEDIRSKSECGGRGNNNNNSHRFPSSSSKNRFEKKKKKKKDKKDKRGFSHGNNEDSDNESSESSSFSSNESSDENRFQKRKVKRMAIERAKMLPLNLSKADVKQSIYKERQKIGSSLADVSPMEMDMGVSFDSIGGCSSHINSLKEMVMFPLLYPELFSKFSINPPRGVLFYGPPGTGKTLIARALASETSKEGRKVAFFMRKGADCLSKWIGESERQLRLLFDQAYLMRPSIIFFDEIDGLAPIRSSRQDQIHSSIVSTLLALMDGLDNRGEIIVIGATNRIDSIDPALRRPGRFDRELRFSLPTREARKEILCLHSKNWSPPLKDSLLNYLADATIGYVGADLKGLLGESALNAMRRRYPQVYKSNQKLAVDFEQISIGLEDFNKALSSLIPSTHRVCDQFTSPLPPHIRPLLSSVVHQLSQELELLLSGENVFRPRYLLCGASQGETTYIGPALLHHFERLPVQRLSIPALYSNTARSPEEALHAIIHEARRSLPSILYIPHIDKLWISVSDTVQKTFLSMISDISPTAPLLILAISTLSHSELPTELNELFASENKEVFYLENPGDFERKEFFNQIFTLANENVIPFYGGGEDEEEDLPVLPPIATRIRELTEKEEKKLRKKEENRLRELRIFLRDIHSKINREQKYFMFRVPVDTVEVYDYLDTIKNPMDFEAMLTKLDNHDYQSAQDFLNDIDLIADNAITYNSDLNYETNKIVCHRAKSLRDFAYALVKQEMDTDFEEECQEIVKRRKALTEKLAKETTKTSESITENEEKRCTGKRVGKRSGTPLSRKKKKSSWISPDGDASEDLITTGVRLDQSKMNVFKLDLLKITQNYNVERLERTYSQLMTVVSKYKHESDRTQLPHQLQVVLEAFKSSSSSSPSTTTTINNNNNKRL